MTTYDLERQTTAVRPVEKAIWYIESHYQESMTLDDLAGVASVSRFHLSRAFCYVTGMPFSRYLRYRRLTHAAAALAAGHDNILDLALSLGYSSHEAFSRAFKSFCGATPEDIRTQGHTDNLELLEAREMQRKSTIDLAEPSIVDHPALLLAGVSRRYRDGSNADIPNQWQQFNAAEGKLHGIGQGAFGVIYNADDNNNFDYLCGIEVANFDDLPAGIGSLRLAAQRYAVFEHPGHVTDVQSVCHSVWGEWLPASRFEASDAPFLEYYPPTFDPRTGAGGFEIWLPVTPVPA